MSLFITTYEYFATIIMLWSWRYVTY